MSMVRSRTIRKLSFTTQHLSTGTLLPTSRGVDSLVPSLACRRNRWPFQKLASHFQMTLSERSRDLESLSHTFFETSCSLTTLLPMLRSDCQPQSARVILSLVLETANQTEVSILSNTQLLSPTSTTTRTWNPPRRGTKRLIMSCTTEWIGSVQRTTRCCMIKLPSITATSLLRSPFKTLCPLSRPVTFTPQSMISLTRFCTLRLRHQRENPARRWPTTERSCSWT
mmetsp:Transcript_131156/g.184995  ORF Transcript_131156/g.184995 Transcript_131156/m.184995 type:complete len:226 (-) Transcript_131156:107-784(-)